VSTITNGRQTKQKRGIFFSVARRARHAKMKMQRIKLQLRTTNQREGCSGAPLYCFRKNKHARIERCTSTWGFG